MSCSSLLRWVIAAGACCTLGLAVAVPGAVAAPDTSATGSPGLRFGPARITGQSHAVGPLTNVTSANWAGYVDKGHPFSYVAATWFVPRVDCTQDDSVASFWVGIDGYRTKTVEQAGTLGYCHRGKATYYTWWEMYPANDVQLVGNTVRVGDEITASVSVSGNTYTLKVVDSTHPANSFTKRATCSSCRNSSVEWIAERPGRAQGLFPLARFGHLTFYESQVGVGRARGSISTYAHDAVTMVNHGGSTLARVSTLRRDGNRFILTWLRGQ